MQPKRVSAISVAEFLVCLKANEPVIVTDAMDTWEGRHGWTPDYFRRQFGSAYVQVYNDAFDLTDIKPLSQYLDQHFLGKPASPGKPVPYVRWYTKLKGVEFVWADEVFDAIKHQWALPYFLPGDGYLLPFCMAPDYISPTDALFPAKGLFISAAGARTRLHRDPWATDALLFQIHGDKHWVMYAPDQAANLCDTQGRCVDVDQPDPSAFPRFAQARPAFEFNLHPGEAVLVPRGWFHHVVTTSDAISLTWNFAHLSTAETFLEYLENDNPSGEDLEVLQFFYSEWLGNRPECNDIAQFLRRRLMDHSGAPAGRHQGSAR